MNSNVLQVKSIEDKINEIDETREALYYCKRFNNFIFEYFKDLTSEEKNKGIWDNLNYKIKHLIYKAKSIDHLLYLLYKKSKYEYDDSENYEGYAIKKFKRFEKDILFINNYINYLFNWESLSNLIANKEDDLYFGVLYDIIQDIDTHFSHMDINNFNLFLIYLEKKFNISNKKLKNRKIENLKI